MKELSEHEEQVHFVKWASTYKYNQNNTVNKYFSKDKILRLRTFN